MFAIRRLSSRFSIAFSRSASSFQFSRNAAYQAKPATYAVGDENMFELCGTVAEKPQELASRNGYPYTTVAILHKTGGKTNTEQTFRFVVLYPPAVALALKLEKGDRAKVYGKLKMQVNYGKSILDVTTDKIECLNTQQRPSEDDADDDNIPIRTAKQNGLKEKSKARVQVVQEEDAVDSDDDEEEVVIVKKVKPKVRKIVQYEDETDGGEDNTATSEQRNNPKQ